MPKPTIAFIGTHLEFKRTIAVTHNIDFVHLDPRSIFSVERAKGKEYDGLIVSRDVDSEIFYEIYNIVMRRIRSRRV